jgi:tetratricopeptide (TPR) repeat protein
MPEAEAVYFEALKIRRQLAEKTPDAFLDDVATTLDNLVLLKFRVSEEAEKYLKESLLIRRRLAQVNTVTQNLELARTLIIGGLVYKVSENIKQSQTYYKEALAIAQQYTDVPLAQELLEMVRESVKK